MLPVLLLLCVVCDGARKWDYEPISMEPHTSDPKKFSIDLRIKRMPRGEFAYDGYLNFAYDVDENTMVEAVAYRSQSGREEEYVLMPWSIEKQPYTKYVEDFYEDVVYSNFGSCTTLPTPEKANPWQRGNYTFKECVVEGKGMPEIAPQGFYKVIFTATGEVDWGIEAVVRITDKHMM
ncbi:uncharacterized protein LOC117785977 [Drosophila innubila]|uniref:uncharacterized protein LOC117785977 n=1 Tax=Drosophila innubila TaxID=198719 RepID=UPI00148C5A21|nr:uncharacterized protein LOC117785977 [Drosophila innubila]